MTLVMTSTDGFASMVVFEDGEIGQVYDGPLFSISGTAVEEENKENVTILFSKDEDTPMVESVVVSRFAET